MADMDILLKHWAEYVELMGDATFAVWVGVAGFALVVFLFLLARLSKKPAPAEGGPGAGSPSPDAGVVLSAGAAPPVPPARNAQATVILPSSELPKPPALPQVAAPPAGPSVDLQMFEAVMRRIAVLEGELKKEPLFLDPIMKRINLVERRAEEAAQAAQKASAVPAAAAPAPGASDEMRQELSALREKVDGLQRILEHLAEGPTPPAP